MAAAAFYFLAWPAICRSQGDKAAANLNYGAAVSHYSMANEGQLADVYRKLASISYAPDNSSFTRAGIDYAGSEDCEPIVFYKATDSTYQFLGFGHERWSTEVISSKSEPIVVKGYGHVLVNDNGWYLLNSVTGERKLLTYIHQHYPIAGASEGILLVKQNNAIMRSPTCASFYDADGKYIVGNFYDAHTFQYGYAPVATDTSLDGVLWGLIDRQGNTVMPLEYSSITILGEDLFCVETNGVFKFVNINGKSVMPGTYTNVESVHRTDFFILAKDGKYGVIDSSLNVILPFEYEKIAHVYNKHFMLTRDGLYGVADAEGNIIVPIEYSYLLNCDMTDADDSCKDFFLFREDGKYAKYGLVGRGGRVIVPAIAEYSSSIRISGSSHRIRVSRGSGMSRDYDYYDFDGNLIQNKGYSLKTVDGNKILFDPDGNTVLNLNETRLADSARASHQAVFNELGFISTGLSEGVLILVASYVPFNGTSLEDYIGGHAIINLDGKVLKELTVFDSHGSSGISFNANGVIDVQGQNYYACDGEIVAISAREAAILRPAEGIREDGSILAGDYQDGLALIWREGKYGLINEQGEYVVTPQYDWIEDFAEGYAVVQLNGRYGYIDRTGAVVIDLQYAYAESFADQRAIVTLMDSTSAQEAMAVAETTEAADAGKKNSRRYNKALIDSNGNILLKDVSDIVIYDDLIHVVCTDQYGNPTNAIYTIDLQRIF